MTAAQEIDIEQLMARIREEVARRKQPLGNLTESIPLPEQSLPAPVAPGLGVLLRHDTDEVFITSAYRALLGRQPDTEGLQSCLAGLEIGTVTRIHILQAICTSEEGRNAGADVRGLTTPYALSELLGGPDPEFVTSAYQALLGREPDEEGSKTYLAHLEQCSLSRIDVLRALRFSEEGQVLKVAVTGLLPLASEVSPVLADQEITFPDQQQDLNLLPILGNGPAEPSLPVDDNSVEGLITANNPSYELGELLGFPDKLFVRNAYRAILRREPDVGGLKTYLGRLRQGSLSKIDILGSLRFSREGRQARVSIHGLLMPWLLHTAYRIPLLGFLMALVSAVLRPSKTIQRLRKLEANLDRQDYQFNETNRFIERGHNWIVGSFSKKLVHLVDRFGRAELELKQVKLLADAKSNGIELAAIHSMTNLLQRSKVDLRQMEILRTSIRSALETKADISEISALSLRLKQMVDHLNTRADRQVVADLQNHLTEMRAAVETRADQQAVNELQGQLRLIDESKVEKLEMAHLMGDLTSLVQAKANTDEVTAIRQQIDVMESTKASNEALAGARDYLQANIENKAGQFALDALQKSVSVKLDTEQSEQKFAEIHRQILDHKRSIVDQQRRLSLLLEEVRKRLPAPLDANQMAVLSGEIDHILDAMYVSFEDEFRGTRTDIKQRLNVYLPLLPSGVGTSFAPAVDLGCGRGEWLELLNEHGLAGTGIDLNRVMVDFCRERELDVVENDALAYLRQQMDSTLGLITGFHIIEHLPLQTLIALFDESLRVLKPGGLIIFETPNPENLIVGACNFYIDPTHRNPMPPIMVRFLVEARGFVRVEIRRVNEGALHDPLKFLEPGTPGAAELNPLIQIAKGHYFTAPDYAVIAYKA